MPEGHDATIEVCNIMSFVLYTQILKQSVLKPASPGITVKTIIDHFVLKAICLNIFKIFRNKRDIFEKENHKKS